ncbi:hypothetical protein L207DRAFT_640105 [Hyaloscypha variabilis F]|uniref:NACHT domain-containing protein n=1 Tax=Hyaloscypha variabilis (strain UAMH 11265 / GT02V1 / F) TaxID=1149755 RepID=A0A2J6R199_HYAVF|nr:hypothetical protein L207DRAFT_640105 [Hyaloscypha variabilis F]
MDPTSGAASLDTLFQLADRVIGLCKLYIRAAKDAPSDLRVILIEITSLKVLLDNFQFLAKWDAKHGNQSIFDSLLQDEGPIKGCMDSISELEKLFPPPVKSLPKSKQKIQELLATLSWPFKQEKAKKILQEISLFKSTISLTLTVDHHNDIKKIRHATREMQTILDADQRDKVYSWLRHTDPSPLHNRARSQYEVGTGDWILRSQKWDNFISAKHRCLWIHGIPGAGKTILASHLIEIIERCEVPHGRKYGLSYYYCYFGHNQEEAAPMLRWFLDQLCRQAGCIPAFLFQLYQDGREPSLTELLACLEALISNYDRVFFIVDAVDESKPREDTLRVLRDLVTDARFNKIQLLVTSRLYIDIEQVLEELSVSVSMSNPEVTADIGRFVQASMQSNPKFRRWEPELLKETQEALTIGAKGMFRWATCQLHELQRLRCESSIIRKALKSLPKTLDETYERAIGNSLTSQGMDPSDEVFDREALREPCGCLIDVQNEEKVIRDAYKHHKRAIFSVVSFAHYTVLEYLLSSRISQGPAAEFSITSDGSYIRFFSVILLAATRVLYDQATWEREKKKWWDNFSLYSIAVTEKLLLDRPTWFPHRSNCLVDEPWRLIADGVLRLVSSEEIFSGFCHGLKHHINASYRAVFGIDSEVWYLGLHAKWADTNAFRLFALALMCGSRYPDIIEYYVEKCDLKSLLNSRQNICLCLDSDYFGTLNDRKFEYEFDCSFIELFAQLAYYRWEDFRLLFKLGVGMFEDYSNILISHVASHYLCEGCRLAKKEQSEQPNCIIEQLLRRGADPDGNCSWVTPLQIAVFTDQPDIVAQLLAAGADPNKTGDREGSKWEGNTILGYFTHLHGHRPLDLIESGMQAGWDEEWDWGKGRMGNRERTNEQMRRLLKQYGARAISVREDSTQATQTVSGNEHSGIPQEGSDNKSVGRLLSATDITMKDDDIKDDLYSA